MLVKVKVTARGHTGHCQDMHTIKVHHNRHTEYSLDMSDKPYRNIMCNCIDCITSIQWRFKMF